MRLARRQQAQGVNNAITAPSIARMSGDDPVAQELQRSGQALRQVADTFHEAKVANEITEAEATVREKLDAFEREIERDPSIDPDSLEETWRTGAQKILEQESGRFGTALGKRAWQARTAQGQFVESGIYRMRDLQWNRHRADVTAGVITQVDRLQQLASDPAHSEALMLSQRDSVLELVDAQERRGMIDSAQAADMRVKVEGQVRTGQALRSTAMIDEALDRGDIAQAKTYFDQANAMSLLPYAERERYEGLIREKDALANAVLTADRLIDEGGGSYEVALAQARQIEDVELRLKVETRLAQLVAQDDAAMKDRREAADVALVDHIVRRGGVSNAPASVLRDADPELVLRMQDREQRLAQARIQGGAERQAMVRQMDKQNSNIAYNLLRGFAAEAPDQFTSGMDTWPEFQRDLVKQLDPEDLSKVIKDIGVARGEAVSAAQGAIEPGEINKVLKDVLAQAHIYFPSNAKLKSFDNLAKGDPAKLSRAGEEMVYANIAEQVHDFVARERREPDPKEVGLIIQRAFADYKPKKFGVSPEFSDPEGWADATYLARQSIGAEPSDEQVAAAYEKITAGQGFTGLMRGVPDPRQVARDAMPGAAALVDRIPDAEPEDGR